MRKGWSIVFALLLLIGCTGNSVPATASAMNAPTPLSLVIDVVVDATDAVPSPMDTPAPTATPMPTETPEPTPTPRPYCPPEGVYTVAWISDPQHYSAKFPELYDAMTLFLRDNREQLHLAYIMHTGDLVNETAKDAQWQVASTAQSYIDDIPNGVLAGNHDCQSPEGFGPYATYFGEKRYRDRPWYGGSYQDNRGHYDLMTIGETDYLFVYMSYGPDKACLKWLNKIFAKYPERVGILLVHDYFEHDGAARSKQGKQLYEQVVTKNPNLYLVFCGHRYGAYRQTTALDDDNDGTPDRTVHEMMFNYQAAGKVGGNGYLRLLQFDDAAGTIHFLTYSPSEDDFNRFDDPLNRETHYEVDETAEDFVIAMPWR